MNAPSNQPADDRKQINQSLVLGAIVGQVGCLTLLIVLAALFGGLWLDNRFDTRPIITVVLMLGSIPLTLIAMFWTVRKATVRLQTTQRTNSSKPQVKEESDSD
jgi:F0F1-type ATP synthase assembly protein I